MNQPANAPARTARRVLLKLSGEAFGGGSVGLDPVVVRKSELLEQRDRCGLVADPHREQAHAGSSTGRGTERCWPRKARTCSSTDRSTLRTSTPAGATSVTGAKFKMLLTPAAASRS